MDSVTQQNAALVEEAAAASQSLQEQPLQLAAVVAGFKLHPREQAALAPRPAKATVRSLPVKRHRAAAAPAIAEPARKEVANGGDWIEF